MKSSPFTAKVSQVGHKVGLDLPELPENEPNVAQQPNLTQIAGQLEPGMFLGADDMDMGRTVIVWEDHHSPAFEGREDGWHAKE